MEAFGNNIKIVEEWSYFEDEDIKPKFFRLFRNLKLMPRTQWTIKATIGGIYINLWQKPGLSCDRIFPIDPFDNAS